MKTSIYNIYRLISVFVLMNAIGIVPLFGILDTEIREDDMKKVQVKAVKEKKEDDNEDTDNTGSGENAPERVTMIDISPSDETSVLVTWQGLGRQGIKYKIYRSDQPLDRPELFTSKTYVASVNDYIEEYIDKNLRTGTYYYAVTTADKLGNENRKLIIDQSYLSTPLVIIDRQGDRAKMDHENRLLEEIAGRKIVIRRHFDRRHQEKEKVRGEIEAREKKRRDAIVAEKKRQEEIRRKKEEHKKRIVNLNREKKRNDDKEKNKTAVRPVENVRKIINVSIRSHFRKRDYRTYIKTFKTYETKLRHYPYLYNEALYYLGRSYYYQGNYRKAIKELLKVRGEYADVAQLIYKNCLDRL